MHTSWQHSLLTALTYSMRCCCVLAPAALLLLLLSRCPVPGCAGRFKKGEEQTFPGRSWLERHLMNTVFHETGEEIYQALLVLEGADV
jgi:hypothetical protein